MAQRANADSNEQTLIVEDGWEIAYRYLPAKHATNQPPIVFLNGLGDTYEAWSPYVKTFESRARLQLDLRGQGRSMRAKLAHDPHAQFRIPLQTQSEDIAKALDKLNIDKVDFAAFSYGGGVAFDFAARFPDRTNKLALIVPYILRLDKSFPMQRLWSWQWNMARHFGLVPNSVGQHVENAYERFLTAYMNHRYEHRMGSNKKVAIDLTYGIMQFNVFDIIEKLPDHSVYLLTGDCDTLVPRSLYREFWRRLPETKRGRWARVEDGEHLLLEQKPELVSQWLTSVLQDS